MEDQVAALRRFNRFFTRHVGAMDARFLGTDLTLPAARLLFEIAQAQPVLATTLCAALGVDAGYLSRMVAALERHGWIARERGEGDGRARPIRLTAAGEAAFAELDRRQHEAVARDLAPLDPVERADLAQALTRARLLLDPASGGPFRVRAAAIGEASMVAARQAQLYAHSHGWGRPLEALEAETVARFLGNLVPEREGCWVAEIDGVMAGAVFLTDEGDGTARLRLLHVEPFARRRGIGDALVARCIAHARSCGQGRILLWTHRVLAPARRLYARHGFRCIASEVHHRFGEPVEGETWELALAATA
jgi:DNA-binding MarR family transcriptional regulator/GNAT superfamily N-acetyltransferase